LEEYKNIWKGNEGEEVMFYTYRQNNSGGRFTINDSVGVIVIVEADSAEEANSRSEDIGIYFYGCTNGIDCSCCGDRWSKQWPDDGDDIPTIYGKDAYLYKHSHGLYNNSPTYVYYLDGSKDTIQTGTER
jgi:hypothetical protein